MSDVPPEASVDVERRSPEAVFELLANEVRVDVLRALGETPTATLSFSELYDRVDVQDSGNFNYHLGKLQGSLVRKTDGYELTHAGRQVLGAIHAGTYTADATVAPFSVGWDCQLCGGDMRVSYRDERAVIRCADCEKGLELAVPPGSLDQFAREELPQAFARWYHHRMQRLVDGFCSVCAGRLAGELVEPPRGTAADPRPSRAEFRCDRCGNVATVTGAALATAHPVVQGFLAEHGFDPARRHPSQIWGALDASTTRVRSEDPLALEVRFEYDGEAVVADVDADASVNSVQRRSCEE
jgi:hypothetical protein